MNETDHILLLDAWPLGEGSAARLALWNGVTQLVGWGIDVDTPDETVTVCGADLWSVLSENSIIPQRDVIKMKGEKSA